LHDAIWRSDFSTMLKQMWISFVQMLCSLCQASMASCSLMVSLAVCLIS